MFQQYNPVSLPVMNDDGLICYVKIPRMNEQAFQFFLRLLEMYKPAIVKPVTIEIKGDTAETIPGGGRAE